MQKLIAIFYVVSGVVILALSGFTQNIALWQHLLGAFAISVAALHVCLILLSAIYRIFSKRASAQKNSTLAFASMLLLGSCIIASVVFTNAMITETKDRGDQLVEQISVYRAQTGKCPKTVSELSTTGVAVPNPALRINSFTLFSPVNGECGVLFPVGFFDICERDTSQSEWLCH